VARVTDYLVADHDRLHFLLALAAAGEVVDREAFAGFRAGLLRHIAIEEKILFPAVRVASRGVPLSRARQLRIEHSAIVSLLVPTPDLALCGELAYLLGRHDAGEEGEAGVYAECERALGEVSSHALAELARAYGEVRVAPHFDGPTVHRTATEALASAARGR